MKRNITITFQVDSTEYEGMDDTDNGTVDLVADMLQNEADLPEFVQIACGNCIRQIQL